MLNRLCLYIYIVGANCRSIVWIVYNLKVLERTSYAEKKKVTVISAVRGLPRMARAAAASRYYDIDCLEVDGIVEPICGRYVI